MKKIFITFFICCFSFSIFASENYELGVKYLKEKQISKAKEIFHKFCEGTITKSNGDIVDNPNYDSLACIAYEIEDGQLDFSEINYSIDTIKKHRDKFEKYCQKGDVFACGYASKLNAVLFGFSEEKVDRKSIVAMSEKSCNGNSGIGCLVYAEELLTNDEIKNEQREEKAVNAFNKACDLKYYDACNKLGAYFLGEYVEVEVEYEKAFNLFKNACDANNDFGCYKLSRLYEEGTGVKKDLKQAKKYEKKACKLNSNFCNMQ